MIGKSFVIYNPTSGEILYTFKTSDLTSLEMNVPDGYSWVEGEADSRTHIVSDGLVVKKSQSIIDDMENARLARYARGERDKRLQSSDWTQVPDAPVDQAAWQVYRQALRDITEQEGFPLDITWPVPPS